MGMAARHCTGCSYTFSHVENKADKETTCQLIVSYSPH
uniref:Uncharacterized protein n=1 Tax=Arundo donax TaxID=35708 RepID=A0A0A8YVC4_ARUDO